MLNNGPVEMRVLVGRVEDECLKNQAIHELSELNHHSLCL